MKKAELVFIPCTVLSHVVSIVEMAKHLLDRDERFSITVLLIERLRKETTLDDYIQQTSSNNPSRLRFINLPAIEETSPTGTIYDTIDNQITRVREIVSDLMKKPSVANSQLAGLVLDMFCTKFIVIAEEFSLPAYVFFSPAACTLGLYLHILSLKFEKNQDLKQFNDLDIELSVPCFSNPVPAKVVPAGLMEEDFVANIYLNHLKRLSDTNGIMVNTFYELEPYAIESMLSDSNKTPKVYPVGPILNLIDDDQSGRSIDDDVKKWLDDQPESSVVFLCFGSRGVLDEIQVKEIASALENSGSRFLWSLRKPGPKGKLHLATEYENFEEVLPEGFLERTKGIGKVIGWAPQVAVLSHPAVGGFVSHCGWNSVLESLWFGVPIATFPLYAEQQLNAFQLVKEQGIVEVIRLDYKVDFTGETPPEIVGSEEIEAAIRRLMAEEGGSGVRQKVKEMQKKVRSALLEGGSSYNAQSLFIEDVIRSIT